MKTALQIGLTALLVGALAFYGGVMYGRASGPANLAARFGGQNGANGFRLNGQGGQGGQGQNGQNGNVAMRGGFANGEILSADSKSITVKMADGSTRTVYLDANTRVVRSSEATTSDLTQGANVVVIGTAGSDGSVTARSVQIVPKGSNLDLFRGGMRGSGAPDGQGGQNGQGGAYAPNGGAPPVAQ